jgi:Asp-tRNA(Asn)/Glu-tRNA(Gln) amidotransferase A subunit family amidase
MISIHATPTLWTGTLPLTAGTTPPAALTPPPSSFSLSSNPADALNGTLSGMTLAAAALGSPALARICSHPLFAGTALFLGAGYQAQAWGHVDGPVAGGLLVLSTIATFIHGRSFYRGLKAGWQALKSSTQLAVYGRVQELQRQLKADLDASVEQTNHQILRSARRFVEETDANVKAAVEHFRDLRDERPQRIEGARQSSLAAFDRAAPERHEIVRQRMLEAKKAAGDAAKKAALTARLTPAMLGRVGGLNDVLETSLEIERLLETTSGGGSVWQRLLVLRSSKGYMSYVRKTTIQAAEADRVASASPRNWVSEAIGDPTYSPTEKRLGHWLGKNVNAGLLCAVPFLATIQALAGGYDYAHGQLSGGGFLQQVIGAVLSLVPAAVTYLYNARQGSRRFRVSPASNQELPFERAGEPELQQRTSRRLESAAPPLEPCEGRDYVAALREKAAGMRAELKALEAIDVPTLSSEGMTGVSLRDTTWMRDRSRRFTPIERPDPNRSYRYNHRPGKPDTDERKRLRRAIKAMTLPQLEEALRYGDVTHVDLFNMIRDHAAAGDGAVMPRPIEGKLEKTLLKMAREADRTGEIRHFVLAKDLFTGIDGAVTAGSKTTHLQDYGKSPLIQRMVDQGFLPIPCSLTAGANGPDGINNGHGAVGNPKIPEYDTAGSSSAEAYLLGLDDFPVRLAIGSDTGGSITAPCGAVGLFGWVPEKGMLSRVNMIPYATHLDTPGVMGVDRSEVLWMARLLTIPAYQNRFEIPRKMPAVYYFKSDIALVSEASQNNFHLQVERLKADGSEVIALDQRFDAYRRMPLDLYQASYVYAAFSLMNPLEENRWGEPQRYIKDPRLKIRMGKAKLQLDTPDEEFGNLFNNYRDLEVRFRDLFDRKFPADAVFITPAPEAVPLDDFAPNGPAGDKLDRHDIQGGMLKNRTDRGVVVDADRRLVIEGRTGETLAVLLGRGAVRPAARANGHNGLNGHAQPAAVPPANNHEVILSSIEREIEERHPPLAEDRYREAVKILAGKILKAWEADGSPVQREPYFEWAEGLLFEVLRTNGNEELLARLNPSERRSGTHSLRGLEGTWN